MALSNSQYESIMRVYNRTQLQKKHELDAREKREDVTDGTFNYSGWL